MSLHDTEIVLALWKYKEAVTATNHARSYGTHGDGRVTAAESAEVSAYCAVLALTAPSVLQSIEGDALLQAEHRRAQSLGTGIAAVEATHALLGQALAR